MKISTASKKVLASALSAAMVVAFAPTVAFGLTSDGKPSTDAEWIEAGATAKVTTGATGEIGAATVKYYDTFASALNAVKTTDGSATITLLAAQDAGDYSLTNSSSTGKFTIDLGGFELVNESGATLTINTKTAATTVVKNGTIVANKVASVEQDAVSVAQGAVTLEGVTTAATVDGISAVKGGTYGAIVAEKGLEVSGTVTATSIDANDEGGTGLADVDVLAGADLTVTKSATKAGVSAIAIDGNVAFATLATGKTAAVTATATATGNAIEKDTALSIASAAADAMAITGEVTNVAKGVTLKATAKASGIAGAVAEDDETVDAVAIGELTDTIENGSVIAVASSIDGTAIAVDSAMDVNGGTVELSAEGKTAVMSIAVDGELNAEVGTYAGKITDFGTVNGGKYTDAGVKTAVDQYHVAEDDGEFWVVSQVKNFTIGTTAYYTKYVGGNDTAIRTNYLEGVLQDISAGKAASGMTFAQGVSASDVLAKAVAGDLKVDYVKTAYNAKKATAEQKAAYEALTAYAKANLSSIEAAAGPTVEFYELTVGYENTEGEYVVLATINDLGTKVDGRTTVPNNMVLRNAEHDKGTVISYNGTVEKMAYSVEDGTTQDYVETAAIPFATAYMSTDEEALKDAVIKGEETPAVEKATQGIDVSKKSMTVKLGAKKTKTAKAKSFSMGASAETELATSKKSGSSKITVSGDKVKLAKGVKRGTYTAKVSLKAAASDAYLAAAKTITVKFVIK